MKLRAALIAAALCCLNTIAFATVTVTITTPTSGATVLSPTYIAARASSTGGTISAWKAYLDGTSVYSAGALNSVSGNLPMSVGSHQVTVRAWDTAGAYGSATLTLNVVSSLPTRQPTVSVAISPTSPVMQVGGQMQFSATVSGSTSGVTWSMTGVGSISSTGMYTAPTTVSSPSATATVTATSIADTTKSASTTVTVMPAAGSVGISISPTTATIQGGTSQQFTATVSGTTNSSVLWAVNGVQGGNATYGLISSTGVYTAPTCPSTGSVTITAYSAYDTTVKASSAVSLTAPTASSSTRYVATTGSDSNDGSACRPWATVAHAGAVATAGMTVHVAPGNYTGAITSNNSGTASARIRYVSEQQWGAKLTSSGTNATWLNYGGYVDIVGFDVTGGGNVGIDNKGGFVRIIGNHVHDIPVPGCPSNGGAGIDHSNYNVGDDDTIGNVVHDIGQFGTVCSRVHGIYHANQRGHIYNNIVFRAQTWGIQLYHYAAYVQVVNNTVFNNGGVYNGNLYGGGIVVSNPGTGTFVDDYTVVANNIVYKNLGWGIHEVYLTGTHNQYVNNLAYANGVNIALQNGLTATGTVSADPQFVNYTGNLTGNYQLKSTSPAIDRGTTYDAPNYDYSGAPRPAGSALDIGAYEYGSKPGIWPWM